MRRQRQLRARRSRSADAQQYTMTQARGARMLQRGAALPLRPVPQKCREMALRAAIRGAAVPPICLLDVARRVRKK